MTVSVFEGTGSFKLNGLVEEYALYSYNESAVVDVETNDYGFINESPTLFDDYENITGDPYYPWQNADYGFLTPEQPLRPYGKLELISTTSDSFTKIYDGLVNVTVSGGAKVFVLPKHNGTGFIRVGGTVEEKNLENYVAFGGSLFGFDSATEATTNVEESKELFKFVGSLVEKFTGGGLIGSGTLFGYTGSAESFGPNPLETGDLFKFAGSAVERNTESYGGFGSLFSVSGHAESVTYSYNESSILGLDSEDYGFITEEPVLEEDYQLTGGQIIYPWQSADYGFLTPDTNLLPYGPIRVISTTADSQTKIYIGSGNITLTSNVKVYVLPKHNGSGFIRVDGSAVEKNTENYVGRGSLFGFSSTTESTSNVETSKELFRFTGSLVEKFTGGGLIGSGSLFGYSGTAESFGPRADEPAELFRINGSATEKNAESYVGSGSLFSIGGHAESVTYSYNESSIVDIESDDYGFITETPVFENDYGLVGDQATYSWQGEDYGYIIPDQPRRPYGRFNFISTTAESETNSYVGSGSLFGFSSTTESKVFKAETTGLFRITGSAAESITPTTEIGSGSIFTFVSFTETATFSPATSTELFKFSGDAYVISTYSFLGSGTLTASGEARIYVLPKHNGSGFIKLYGRGFESITPQTEIGSGSIFTFVSFTETAVYNPPERTELFRITGRAIEKNTESYRGTGSSNVDGSATTIFRLRVTETGRDPIKISGNGLESRTPATEIGSGSIFTFASATESISNAESSKELFKFSGSAVEKNTEAYRGFGKVQFSNSATTIFRLRVTETGRQPIKIVGDAVQKNTESYRGSGSIFTFKSTTVSKSNAESSKELFRITGKSRELASFNPPEFGDTIRITGNAIQKNTESYIGRGSLFGFSSTTESISNAETSRELFKFSGKGRESFTPAPHVGSGSIFTFVSSTQTKTTSEVSAELFRITGTAVERNTENYVGRGSLFGFSSTTESAVFNPSESTILFKFSGKGAESITPAPHVGSGSIFTFVSFTETRSVSEKSEELFRITGSAVERNTEAYKGTGLLTTLGSKSTTIFRLKVISDGALLRINGKSKESFGYGLYTGAERIAIDIKGRDRTIPFESRKPPRIYII